MGTKSEKQPLRATNDRVCHKIANTKKGKKSKFCFAFFLGEEFRITVQSRFHSILSLYSGMPLALHRWPPESGLATKGQGAILVKKQLKYFKILVSWIIYGFFFALSHPTLIWAI